MLPIYDVYYVAIDWCYDHDDTYTETDVIQSERIQTSFTGWFDTEHTMATLTSSLVTEIDLKEYVYS